MMFLIGAQGLSFLPTLHGRCARYSSTVFHDDRLFAQRAHDARSSDRCGVATEPLH
jgi:hypothetical protein